MADPPVGPGTNATSWPERVAASAIPSVLGAAAFAVSFSNVRDVALANGTGEWRSWMLAASVELLALGAALEVRRRRARGEPNVWPWLVLLAGIVATVAANLDTAEAPGWGTVVAVWPALAYLLAASLKATRPAVRTPSAAVPDSADDSTEIPAELRLAPEPAPEPDPLLEPARRLYADGRVSSRTALGKALRDDGHAVATERVRMLWQSVTAEVAA